MRRFILFIGLLKISETPGNFYYFHENLKKLILSRASYLKYSTCQIGTKTNKYFRQIIINRLLLIPYKFINSPFRNL